MYRIGQEEIAAVSRVIETRDMFKINGGLQESKKVEEALSDIMGTKYPIFMTSGHAAHDLSGLVVVIETVGQLFQVVEHGPYCKEILECARERSHGCAG